MKKNYIWNGHRPFPTEKENISIVVNDSFKKLQLIMKNDLPQRKRTRHKDYDYSTDGYYFITTCVKGREEMLGFISNDKLVLTEYGRIVESCWLDLPNHYKNCNIDYFVVMPDHFHGIVIIDNAQKDVKHFSLSEIIGGFKSFSSRKINECKKETFEWQKSFYDRIIRNEKELYEIRKYIEQNPLKWELEKGTPENLFM